MDVQAQSSTISEYDAEAVLSAVDETAGEQLRVFAEYDDESYNVLYLADAVHEVYEDAAKFEKTADALHADYRLDFTEKQMHEEVYSDMGEVRAFAVFLTDQVIFRFVGRESGLYVSLALDAPFNRVISTVYSVIDVETDR
jgi:hypothetical protein